MIWVFTILPVVLLLTIVSGCDYPYWIDDTPVPQQITQSPKSFLVGPEGDSFHALNGNVSMEIPEGALDEKGRFVIKKGTEDSDNDFIIKSIKLEPKTVSFNIPVRLRL